MKNLKQIVFVSFFILLSQNIFAQEKKITIIHTNDMHSHLLGFAPNLDYNPKKVGADNTLGGWARIATLIKNVKQSRKNHVIVLDAGDFTMGSLFHLLTREESFELRLMKQMGYDAVTLGNHEFDLMPDGLARIISTAYGYKQMPAIVFSNIIFSKNDKKDIALKEIFNKGIVKPYMVMEKDGIKIGLFGLIGKNAAEYSPFAKPVTFESPIIAAKRIVKILREQEKADIVICLSHSGLWKDKSQSEDEILPKQVDGIDIIISGHTHTKSQGIITVNKTFIVSAWEYGKEVGVLDISYNNKNIQYDNYKVFSIDSNLIGDEETTKTIESYESLIDKKVLSKENLSFRKIIAHTEFDLKIMTDESSVGNLFADSVKWYANKYDYDPKDPLTKVSIAILSNGLIRDNILAGKTGSLAVCDLFRSIPLGVGMDGSTMAYPIVSFYIYASEIKKALEVLTSIAPIKGDDYFLQISGVKFKYNPHRMIFDRVYEIFIGNEEEGYAPLDYSQSNKNLYRAAANIYNSTFLKLVGDFTWHILDITPKDRNAKPIDDLKTVRIDADKNMLGIQELKEWKAVMNYIVSCLPDKNNDGIPEIPYKYKGKLGRINIDNSLNPYNLLKNGNYLTWCGLTIILFIITCTVSLLVILLKKLFR